MCLHSLWHTFSQSNSSVSSTTIVEGSCWIRISWIGRMRSLWKVWNKHQLKISAKVHMFCTLASSALLYGSETSSRRHRNHDSDCLLYWIQVLCITYVQFQYWHWHWNQYTDNVQNDKMKTSGSAITDRRRDAAVTLSTDAQLYEKLHMKRLAICESPWNSSEMELFDRPHITSY